MLLRPKIYYSWNCKMKIEIEDKKNFHNLSCNCCKSGNNCTFNRRTFIKGLGAGIIAAHLPLSLFADENQKVSGDFKPLEALKLKIQPVLAVTLFQKAEKTSWRPWGGFHTQKDIDDEKLRIKKELDKIAAGSQFPFEVLPLATVDNVQTASQIAKGDHDLLLMYPANCWVDVLEALTNPEKWTIVFARHDSGPVYLWYEVMHNRYLRKTVDEFGQPSVDYQDIVIDNLDELEWRFRALYGLKNTLDKKIVCIGGPAGWGEGGKKAPDIARTTWKMDLQTVDLSTFESLIKKAKQDKNLVSKCENAVADYLNKSEVSLETNKTFVVNAFILTEVFKDIMRQAGTDSITVNHCMGPIIGIAETTACLSLSILNDAGFTAFCESDFVVIPSGVLLHYISSLPVFLNDPTYPHDGMVTIAHCTAPRKMNGKSLEPVRILTHFESDYGAAPKVQMKKGQVLTNIVPDFNCKKWLGFEGTVIDNPFLDICRSQVDISVKGSIDTLNAETKGFHWMTCYGSFLKETGYALKKLNINWLNLSA